MNISDEALEFLVGLITGDSKRTPYRTGPKLVELFNRYGFTDLYGAGFPARHSYVRVNLRSINGSARLKEVVEGAFNWWTENERGAEDNAFQFTRLISPTGYKLKKDHYRGFMEGAEYVPGPLYFEIVKIDDFLMEAPTFFLTHDNLSTHVIRCRERIEKGDYAGAITLSYTMVEEFIKLSLRAMNVSFAETEGDIRKLYRLLAGSSGLQVSDETAEALKPLLGALSAMVAGFFEIANKAGDRHAAKYRADRHHAKLVVSLAMSFCDFLIDSMDYRKSLIRETSEQRA